MMAAPAAPNQQFLDIWAAAVTEYAQDTGITPDGLSKLQSVEEVIGQLRHDGKSFEAFRKKGEKMRAVVKPILGFVAQWAETAGEGAAVLFPPAKAISVAMGVVVQASWEVTAKYEEIHDMLESLGSMLHRFQVHVGHQVHSALKDILIQILRHLILILGLATKLLKEGRTVTFVKSLLGKTSEVSAALARLDKLCVNENQMVSTLNLAVTSQILGSLKDSMTEDLNKTGQTLDWLKKIYNQAMSITQLSVKNQGLVEEIMLQLLNYSQEIKTFASDLKMQTFYQWLSAPEHWLLHYAARKARQSGTGTWFLQELHFKQWQRTSNSFLWVKGKMGAGKSILCSSIIDNLLANQLPDANVAVAFHYITFADSATQNPGQLLRSLICQLSSNPMTHSILLDFYTHKKMAIQPPNEHDLGITLKNLVNIFHQVYIVVDGLDECSNILPMLELLVLLTKWELDHLHILVTSRHEDRIHRRFDEFSRNGFSSIQLLDSAIDQDIAIYLQSTMEEDPDFKGKAKDKIKLALMQRANGMFKWVHCQIDALRQCLSSEQDLEDALQNLPRTLFETYDQVLSKIGPQHQQRARKIFQWLAFAYRPMTLREIVELLAVEFANGPRFNAKQVLQHPEDILTICSNLAVVKKNDRGDDELHLAHFSIKEYLMSPGLYASPNALYHLNPRAGHMLLAQTCLAYLLQLANGPAAHICPSVTAYAATHWSSHIQNKDLKEAAELLGPMMNFFQPQTIPYETWLEQREGKYTGQRYKSPLYWASFFGILQVCKSLLDKSLQPKPDFTTTQSSDVTMETMETNANNESSAMRLEYGEALQGASLNGHLTVVEQLLAKRAGFSTQGREFSNALQAASFNGHLAIVQLLLQVVDINAQGGEYGNALQAACFNGHSDIVELLLTERADINPQDGEFDKALHDASFNGHIDTVKLLLDKGAQVNAQGGEFGTALQAASCSGHLPIVELLLANRADIHAQGGEYGNALQAACYCEHVDIVELLLARGANINVEGGDYGNPLQAASSNGHLGIVQLQLANGADINSQGGVYGNALQAASFYGHFDVVQLLLAEGAHINTQGGEYGNALQAASFNGFLEIVELLLGNGAAINAQGGEYGNALQAASSNGHIGIVKLLLSKGAEVNAQGGGVGNALQAASYNGHQAIVELLLTHGADINAQGGVYGNAQVELKPWGLKRKCVVKDSDDAGSDVRFVGEKVSRMRLTEDDE